MAFVIIGSLVTACLLLLQGVHIVRSGNMRPFFEQPGDLGEAHPSLKTLARLAGASLFAIPSLAVFGILLVAFLRNDVHRVFDWLTGHVMAAIGGLFLLIYGLVALLRPDVVIRWIASAFPDYDLGTRNPSVQHFVRGLGAFVVAFGLFIFKSV
jgi:formate hydrogenlyase subunit 3/multisubunit Na+/H+ antiporter MnhD subunit